MTATQTRPRILLDVDGVLADFVSAYLDIVERVTGRRYQPHDVTSFDIGESLGLARAESAACKRALGNSPCVARTLGIYPGAREGVRRLNEIADVYIVTSPWNSNPTWTHDREWWLHEHFRIPHSRIVHTSAKHLCRGDFLVDDRTETLRQWHVEHPGGIAVQWRTPHNRLDGWNGISTCSWDELVALASVRSAEPTPLPPAPVVDGPHALMDFGDEEQTRG